MISEKLRLKFSFIKTIMFPEWQKANEKERNRICKRIGEFEGREIIKEINKSVEKLCLKK